MEKSKLYTAAEVATAAGTSAKSVYSLARKGRIHARVLGDSYIVEEAHFEEAVRVLKAHKAKRLAHLLTTPPVVLKPASPLEQAARPIVLGSETIVAAIESLETALNKNDAVRTQESIALRTLVGALVAIAREQSKAWDAAVAELRLLRKDMNDAFEAAIERKADAPVRNSEHAIAK